MRATLLIVLLPLFACGVEAPPPVATVASAAPREQLTVEPLVPGSGGPGGQNSPCAAADCNDRDPRQDYIDPGPDGENVVGEAELQAGKARAR